MYGIDAHTEKEKDNKRYKLKSLEKIPTSYASTYIE
jgi:hypothetical protein